MKLFCLLAVAFLGLVSGGAFDAPVPGTVYKIGGLAIRGAADLLARFQPTFSTYLNETVGAEFNITFETIPMSFDDTFNFVPNKDIDFIYTNPSAFSCVESEYGVAAIVSLRNYRQGNQLNQFGGIVFTRHDRTDITSLYDLKDKIVEAVSITGLGACQMQWRLMVDKGMNLLTDPAQVIFAFNQKKIVQDVIAGNADVGFVRTDLTELMAKAGEINLTDIKVIDPVDLGAFPFPSSTSLYPEWSLAALPHVPAQVQKAVAKALMNINSTHYAAQAGTYATWDAPISYMTLRDMQEKLGWIDLNTGACMRSQLLYEAIVCPPGYFKLPESSVNEQCASQNRTCPIDKGYECLCRPCQKLEAEEYTPMRRLGGNDTKCKKMTLCAIIQQQEEFSIAVTDNWFDGRGVMGLAAPTSVQVDLRVGSEVLCYVPPGIKVACSEGNSTSNSATNSTLWNMGLSIPTAGITLAQVRVNGLEIESSPFLLEIVPRDCSTVGDGRVPDVDGNCVCPQGLDLVDEDCIGATLSIGLIIIIVVAALLLAVGIIFAVIWYRRILQDRLWLLPADELVWLNPPVTLGRGSFGQVLKGNFRGVDVAVKRVIPGDTTVRPEMSVNRSMKKKGKGKGNISAASSFAKAEASILAVSPAEGKSAAPAEKPPRATDMHILDAYEEAPPVEDVKKVRIAPAPTSSEDSSATTSAGETGFGPQKQWSRSQRRQAMKDFYKEMRVLSALRHPNITTVMGAIIQAKRDPLMVMECMDRGAFYDLLHNPSVVLEASTLLGILQDVACGITYLHASDLLHNDLKAQNILVDRNFRAKVADFGLASAGERAAGAVGTPYWMAPELLRDEPCSQASDVYSFAIVLYEGISRQEPYAGLDPFFVLDSVADPSRTEANWFRPTIPTGAPEELVALMRRCWHANPHQRPTFKSLQSELGKMDEAAVDDAMKARMKNKTSGPSGLPKRFSTALQSGHGTEPESFDPITCVFTDIVGYSALSSQLTSTETIDMLDRLYLAFDEILKGEGMYCVDIIGDAYMAVSGLMGESHVEQLEKVSRWCIGAVKAATALKVCDGRPELGTLHIRAGVHTGPCTVGVVGKVQPRFSLFGDTINVAARMESLSRSDCIQISAAAANVLTASDSYLKDNVKPRGVISVKGKGKMEASWLTFAGGVNPESIQDHDLAGK